MISNMLDLPKHLQVIFFINAKDAWSIIIIEFLILFGDGWVGNWLSHAGTTYSVYYFMSERLELELLTFSGC